MQEERKRGRVGSLLPSFFILLCLLSLPFPLLVFLHGEHEQRREERKTRKERRKEAEEGRKEGIQQIHSLTD